MKVLDRWMKFTLRFVAVFNVCAGLHMLLLSHETYKVIGIIGWKPESLKPQIHFPIQLVGILVGLFGWGYYLVARNPVENRNILLLGFFSKLLGSVLGFIYVLLGKLPWTFVVVFFFCDLIYLPPFYLILRRLFSLADQERRGEIEIRGHKLEVKSPATALPR